MGYPIKKKHLIYRWLPGRLLDGHLTQLVDRLLTFGRQYFELTMELAYHLMYVQPVELYLKSKPNQFHFFFHQKCTLLSTVYSPEVNGFVSVTEVVWDRKALGENHDDDDGAFVLRTIFFSMPFSLMPGAVDARRFDRVSFLYRDSENRNTYFFQWEKEKKKQIVIQKLLSFNPFVWCWENEFQSINSYLFRCTFPFGW